MIPTIKNLTPHPIVLRNPVTGVETTIAPEPTPARVDTFPGHELSFGVSEGALCAFETSPTQGPVSGLPDPQSGVLFVVSTRVAQRLAGSGRRDVFSPGTGFSDGAIRDDMGRVIAVTKLIRVPQ